MWLYILMITWLWEKRRGTWWWKMHWLTQTFSEGRLWAARSRLQQWLSYKRKILLKISTYILRSVVGCGNWCAHTYRTLGWYTMYLNLKSSTNTFGRIWLVLNFLYLQRNEILSQQFWKNPATNKNNLLQKNAVRGHCLNLAVWSIFFSWRCICFCLH